MITYRTCVFCNRSDSRPTNEDIFAEWIAKQFPEPTRSTWEAIDLDTSSRYKTKNKIGFISNKVCKRCNNGWMAKLEDAAKPVMSPLINGSRTILSPDNQVVIAKWLIKTAAMCDILAKHPYFQAEERQAIVSGMRPANTWMFLACYRGPHIGELAARGRVYHADPNPSLDDQQKLLDPQGYALTILIKHLALQIVSVRSSERLPTGSRITMPARWADASIHIPVNRDVIWPPPLVFDKDGFEEFASRWGDLGQIA